MSTIHGDKGFYSLTAIYVTFGFGTFLSPTVEGLLGPKLSIILSSLPYSLFVLSVGFPLFWVTTGLAVLVGFSASLLWIANGVCIDLLYIYMRRIYLQQLGKMKLDYILEFSTDCMA
jgi:ABC-type antimicrobial peptide transport system permease subunit